MGEILNGRVRFVTARLLDFQTPRHHHRHAGRGRVGMRAKRGRFRVGGQRRGAADRI
jgi:hypothetical protein